MSTIFLWTVYERPSDFPEQWVARRFEVTPSGSRPLSSADDVVTADSFEVLRDEFQHRRGLMFLPPQPDDDPTIRGVFL